MPIEVTPQVFHLATTRMVPEHRDFLAHMGVPDWTTDTDDDAAVLTEIAGRSCYRSFQVGLNKNVTRTREGNAFYIGDGILRTKHGSVLEHSFDTFALVDVSRVITHELARHRAGTAFSQESGRFVRVDEVRYYHPEALKERYLAKVFDELWKDVGTVLPQADVDTLREAFVTERREEFAEAVQAEERLIQTSEALLGLDDLKSFTVKKTLQSAIRRAAPFGIASTVVFTANQRAFRHMVEVRTHGGAEEEIRLVFWKVFEKLRELHPNIYQDAELSTDEWWLPQGVPQVGFRNEKV